MALMDGGSGGGNDDKDASAMRTKTLVQQGFWQGCNNGKDASNRGNNATGNN
jgi:hypothetical protein